MRSWHHPAHNPPKAPIFLRVKSSPPGEDQACSFRSRSPRSPSSSLPPYSPALPPAVPHTPGELPLGLECSLPLAGMLLSMSGMFTPHCFQVFAHMSPSQEALGAASPALAQRPLSSFLAVCFPTAAITVQHYFIYCIVVFPVDCKIHREGIFVSFTDVSHCLGFPQPLWSGNQAPAFLKLPR